MQEVLLLQFYIHVRYLVGDMKLGWYSTIRSKSDVIDSLKFSYLNGRSAVRMIGYYVGTRLHKANKTILFNCLYYILTF